MRKQTTHPKQGPNGGLIIRLEGKTEAVNARLKTLERTDRLISAAMVTYGKNHARCHAEVMNAR